jgi:hypothetical protein
MDLMFEEAGKGGDAAVKFWKTVLKRNAQIKLRE